MNTCLLSPKKLRALLSCVLLLAISGHATAQWEQVLPGASAYSLCISDGSVYAGLFNNGFNVSSDHGATWSPTATSPTDVSNWAVVPIGSSLFVGTQYGAGWRSTDGGATWTNIGLYSPRNFVMHNDTLFACVWTNPAVYYSVDNGDSWSPVAGTFPSNAALWPMLSKGPYLFVGAQGGGVYRSSDDGGTWMQMDSGIGTTSIAYAFATMGTDLFVGRGAGGVFRSSDDGATWTASPTGLGGLTIYALHAVDSLLFAGSADNGVYLSTDSGTTWTQMNTGLGGGSGVTSFAHDDQYLYAGTLNSGVYRWPWAPVKTSGIHEASALADGSVHVAPDPFTGSTTLHFTLTMAEPVSVTVLDETGRKVEELPTAVLPAGPQQLAWNAQGLPQGTYFCRVQAGGERYTLRAVLLR